MISACEYIVNHAEVIAKKNRLTTLITDDHLDNVPFHGEKHREEESRMACLIFIVNSFISAFNHFKDNDKLKLFFFRTVWW